MRSWGKSLPRTKSKESPSPIFFRRRFGILTRPMSSVVGAWAQASATKILASSVSPASAAAPFRKTVISPLYPANRMEKDVSRLSSGFAAQTVGKAWESVMMSFGGFASADKVCSRQSAVQLMTEHFLSSSSRMVWTWGRISRPLGA